MYKIFHSFPFILVAFIICTNNVKSVITTTTNDHSNITYEGLIINGTRAQKGSFPWMVAIYHEDNNISYYICGATLISETIIITAAHCLQPKTKEVKDAKNLRLYFGDHDLLVMSQNVPVIPNRITIHPDWKNTEDSNFDADLALIYLDEGAIEGKNVKPIKLWEEDELPDTNGTVAGWGQSENRSIEHETTLKEVIVPIIASNENCFLKEPPIVQISSTRTFCAGSRDGSGPCRGDSGSGLIVKHEEDSFLVGIVSASLFVDFVCDTNRYALYTNIIKFKQWIDIESNLDMNVTSRFGTDSYARGIDSRRKACGTTEVTSSLIQNGEESSKNQWPWTVAIYIFEEQNNFVFKSTGTFVSINHVLVDASTVSRITPAGKYIPIGTDSVNVYHGDQMYGNLMIYKVQRITIHPNFSKKTKPSIANIAILKLKTGMRNSIIPICLWKSNANFENIEGKTAFGVGWGADGSKPSTEKLKHISVTIRDNTKCLKTYTNQLTKVNATTYFCAGGERNGTPCLGDDPLYIKENEKWFLRGMFSLSFRARSWLFEKQNTCKDYDPVLYEDMAYYTNWIQQQIKN